MGRVRVGLLFLLIMFCTKCGCELPDEKFEMMKTGTRRRVCNHCRWIHYVQPSRMRRILRELG